MGLKKMEESYTGFRFHYKLVKMMKMFIKQRRKPSCATYHQVLWSRMPGSQTYGVFVLNISNMPFLHTLTWTDKPNLS